MELALTLEVLLVICFIVLGVLIGAYFVILLKNKKKSNTEIKHSSHKEEIEKNNNKRTTENVLDFMEFDEIKDNMIIRKDRKQYVMIVKCKGVNYDLMSEEEKVSVEAGFVQFLNTLRFPIQLYVQTTSLNLRDIILDYQKRIQDMEVDLKKTEDDLRIAKKNGNKKEYDKLYFEKRRKENVLEYSADISEYISRMSMNKDILQQKTYLVISYYSAEITQGGEFSKEEIDNLCFSELYTRTQTAIRALEAEYDSLYSTAKDVLKKKEEVLNEAVEREAVDLAANSITIADDKRKKEEKIQKKALEILEEYKNQMDEDLYQKSKEEILNKNTTNTNN